MRRAKRELFYLDDAYRIFHDEQTAIDKIREIRWGNNDVNAYCPHCKSSRVYHFSDNKTHKCGECRKKFSIKVGTIFEDSKLPLKKWAYAIWFMGKRKKPTSVQLSIDLNITQKTAWQIMARLIAARKTSSFHAPLKINQRPTLVRNLKGISTKDQEESQ